MDQTLMHMQANQLWQAVLGQLQASLSKSVFDNWLRQTTMIDFVDDVAVVAAPNTFSVSTLQMRYASKVEAELAAIVGRPVRVRFTVMNSDREEQSGAEQRKNDVSVEPRRVPEANRPKRVDPPPPQANQLELAPTTAHGLNPRYVYANYVVGSSNRFAHAASLSVAEKPGGMYNPFFIHGGVGLGKTHLLHAIGHQALELRPNLSIVYVSSEKFTNDVINGIRTQRMDDFRSRYRTIDILMIDDIQFIAGKESTQEEFFHTFNTLYQSGKQVIITSDKPPKAIAALEDRLRSRFEGGLSADVQLPDYEMRIAILRTKAEEFGILIPADVVEYIAQRDQANIRELEGAMNKVVAFSQISHQPIGLQLAMEALSNTAIGPRKQRLTAADVVGSVVRHYNVSMKDLQGRSRTRDVVGPRQVAMYLLREETGLSLVDIGQQLGNRDHTTVMHGISKIEREMETDPAVRQQLMLIREALYTGSD
jgi:chromosomal replication initiator protein